MLACTCNCLERILHRLPLFRFYGSQARHNKAAVITIVHTKAVGEKREREHAVRACLHSGQSLAASSPPVGGYGGFGTKVGAHAYQRESQGRGHSNVGARGGSVERQGAAACCCRQRTIDRRAAAYPADHVVGLLVSSLLLPAHDDRCRTDDWFPPPYCWPPYCWLRRIMESRSGDLPASSMSLASCSSCFLVGERCVVTARGGSGAGRAGGGGEGQVAVMGGEAACARGRAAGTPPRSVQVLALPCC